MASKRPTRQTCQANRASNRSRQPSTPLESPAEQRRPGSRTKTTPLGDSVSRRAPPTTAPQPMMSANHPQWRL